MAYNYQGAPQYGQKADKKKESPVNKCEFTGYTRTRGNYPEIKVNELPSGSASVKFSLECREYTGNSDENGNPKVRTTYVPVSVWTNKSIPVAMLKSIVPGMKVHVVGRLSNQHYKDKNGQDKNFTECEAYVLEILESPQMMAAPQMPYNQPYGYGQQPMPQQGYAPQQQMPMPPQYGAPVQQPYYPQQPYPQQVPQYPAYAPQPQAPQPQAQPQNGYGQQAPQQGRQAVTAPQQQSQAPVPPYYQRPQGQQVPPQGGAPAPELDDLPVGDVDI